MSVIENNNNKLTNHPIVNKPDTNFVYTNPSTAFEGTINPLERRITTNVLSIDSTFRENSSITTSNNFMYKLQNPLYKVISMKLISFELPQTWDNISDTLENNTFVINLSNMIIYPDSIQTIILPSGNYTNTQLITSINNYFNNICNGLNYLQFNINNITNKCSFYIDPSNNIYDPINSYYSPNFSYTIDFVNSNFGKYLGYKNTTYSANIYNTYNDIITTSPAVLYYGYIQSESSLSIENYIFLYIDDFNKNFDSNTIVSQTYDSLISNNILGRITLNTFNGLSNNLIINNNNNNGCDYIFKLREYYGPVRIRQLQIKLLNKYGKEINLLNNDYSFALEFNLLHS